MENIRQNIKLYTLNFVIYGTNQDGEAQIEQLAGPDSTTVNSTAFFKTVTRIQSTASSTNSVEVGVTNKQAVSYFDITGSRTGGNSLGYHASSTHVGTIIRYAGNEVRCYSW